MTDNVSINAANNQVALIASETFGVLSAQCQVVKPVFGSQDVQQYISSASPLPVSNGLGVGYLQSIPSGTSSGTSLNSPSYYSSVRFYLHPGDLISYSISNSATGSPYFTLFGNDIGVNWDEPLSNGQNVYIVSASGNPLYRFL
jgi:hypothetical protein